jgi:hypothetical protein
MLELPSERNPQMQLNEYKSQNQNLYSVNSIILINHTFMTLNKKKTGDYIHTCVNMKI